MKRRDFLFGIASAIPAATLGASLAVASAGSRGARIGLLLPERGDVERQFLAGWRAAGAATPSLTERLGAGHAQALKTVTGWLEGNRVDVIVSALSAHGPQVRAHLEAHGVPMLVAEFGANWARPSSGSALIVRQGSRMAEGAFALGRHAAQSGSRTATIVTTSFDAGFDYVRAFELGFTGQGGTVQGTLLLDSSAVPWDAARLAELGTDAVFVAASEAVSLQNLRVPPGMRLLAGGLAGWLLGSSTLETALAGNGARHPAFTLGLEAAQTVVRANELMQSGLHALPALIQARTVRGLERLELQGGRVVSRHALADAPAFNAGVQMLSASRSSGYSNAYPVR